MSEILDMKMKLSCKWECKLKKKKPNHNNKKTRSCCFIKRCILVLVQALPKHGFSSPVTLKVLSSKHEHAFELQLAVTGNQAAVHHV